MPDKRRGDGIPADWPKPPKRRGIVVDWPCFHAEQLEEVPGRPADGLSWRRWHMARGDFERAARHPQIPAVTA